MQASPARVAASVVDDRLVAPAMNADAVAAASAAGQPIGLVGLDEAGVAGALIGLVSGKSIASIPRLSATIHLGSCARSGGRTQ